MQTNENPFVVLPKITIRPDKIVLYNQFIRRNQYEKQINESPKVEVDQFLVDIGAVSVKLPDTNKHNFELSKKATARIKEKVTWLYSLAKTQTVVTHNNKVLHSFKMNFITLTLPSMQRHTTPEIISKCLNQFFTECNQRFKMVNYVWRLEFQQNGNAHFHIATDVFTEYWQIRSIWNRCINKLGYVDEYQKSNIGQTFHEYLKKNPVTEKNTFEILKKRFSDGCASRWGNPNTADVRCVTNHKNISFYISKYITKKSEHKLNPIVSEREEENTNMRLWFCSRSLSRVDKISEFCENISDDITFCMSYLKEVKMYIFDYCEVMYFNIKDQSNQFKATFRRVLYDYATRVGYFGKLSTS